MNKLKEMWSDNHYAPLHVIAWRIIWFIPMQLARIVFCACAIMAWGWNTGKQAWRDTE